MKIEVDISKDELLNELGELSGDIDFIVNIVDNMTRNYSQVKEVISSLFVLLPKEYRDNMMDELKSIEP